MTVNQDVKGSSPFRAVNERLEKLSQDKLKERRFIMTNEAIDILDNIVGLGLDGSIYTGYDGLRCEIDNEPDDDWYLCPQDIMDIADAMIQRWSTLKTQVEKKRGEQNNDESIDFKWNIEWMQNLWQKPD